MLAVVERADAIICGEVFPPAARQEGAEGDESLLEDGLAGRCCHDDAENNDD